MDQSNEYETPEAGNGHETPDSGIFSPGNSSSSRRSSMSSEGQSSAINGNRSTVYDSGISTPSGRSGAFSQPVDPEQLKSALNLQLTVSGPSGTAKLLNISEEQKVDQLIDLGAKVCGLGTGEDVYLVNGSETLQRGSNLTVRQAKIANGSKLQLMTRCRGG